MKNIAQLKKLYDSRIRNAQARTFTEEELTKVKTDAYLSGLAVGKNEAVLEVNQRQELMQKELIYNLQLYIDKYLAEQASLQTNLSNLILNLSVTLFKKTFPTYASKKGLEEIITFIEIQLKQLKALPELIITVHPENLENILSICKKIISDNNWKIQVAVKESADFELSDCTIHWESGCIEKKLNNILDNLSLAIFDPANNSINE